MEGNIRDIVHGVLMEVMYYHGTSSANAGGIVNNGLDSRHAVERIGGSGEGFESAAGRSYVTSDYGNAMRYGLMSDGDDDVHVFGFDVTPDGDGVGLDEDEVGSYLYMYLNGRLCDGLAFDRKYLSLLSPEELKGIKSGSFRAYAATKKLIDRLTPEEVHRMLNARNKNGNPIFRNLTVSGNHKPVSHYTVRRPNEDERDRMYNYRKYGDKTMEYMRDYYMKNRKLA